jgi:hypothetical protein
VSGELVGVGVPVSVTSGKRSASEGKGASVAVLVEVMVSVDTIVAEVAGDGVKILDGRGVLVAWKEKVVAEGIRVAVIVPVGCGVNVGPPGVIVKVGGLGDKVPVAVGVGVVVSVIPARGIAVCGSEKVEAPRVETDSIQ